MIENIHPDLDHNFPSPKINSCLINVHHNDPGNLIDYPEDFHQY